MRKDYIMAFGHTKRILGIDVLCKTLIHSEVHYSNLHKSRIRMPLLKHYLTHTHIRTQNWWANKIQKGMRFNNCPTFLKGFFFSDNETITTTQRTLDTKEPSQCFTIIQI